MVDFHSFETFDPNGPGLGNLFGQVSPFEALGVWPSGDFRLAPGDGAVPALGYYLGIAFGLVLFAYGLARGWVRREGAILAGVGAAALAYLAARIGGTPYTAAKAIEVGSSVIALAILLPLLDDRGAVVPGMRGQLSSSRRGVARVASLALSLFLLAAGACSLLALANAPVGPTSYTPALTGLRSQLGGEPTLVLARPQLLDEQHGAPYVAWELRGQRVCIAAAGSLERPPAGVKFVVAEDEGTAPFPGLDPVKTARPFTLWRDPSPRPGESPCPLIAVRQARQGPAR